MTPEQKTFVSSGKEFGTVIVTVRSNFGVSDDFGEGYELVPDEVVEQARESAATFKQKVELGGGARPFFVNELARLAKENMRKRGDND